MTGWTQPSQRAFPAPTVLGLCVFVSLLQVENVKLLDRYAGRKAASGTLYLTATHLIYVDASAEVRKETWVCVKTHLGKLLQLTEWIGWGEM